MFTTIDKKQEIEGYPRNYLKYSKNYAIATICGWENKKNLNLSLVGYLMKNRPTNPFYYHSHLINYYQKMS
ncbi:MAG: hypothetical protein LBQ59_01410 [Candidatus Peribacteria bacterium]|nr:hypothetical protein [Candidatus Peribacteria bacterium]